MMPKPTEVPIWGGGASDRALKIVADACDGWHPSNLSPLDWRGRADVLKDLASRSGRDDSEITLTARPGRARPVDQQLADEYARAGVAELICDIEYRSLSLVEAIKRLEQLALELKLS
jgi:alkanesulfonate monooxygenase SsuD/methylene tetrahydromethanopterin reductase-like flavin-dependent oxidoreductase (luciferase family)